MGTISTIVFNVMLGIQHIMYLIRLDIRYSSCVVYDPDFIASFHNFPHHNAGHQAPPDAAKIKVEL